MRSLRSVWVHPPIGGFLMAQASRIRRRASRTSRWCTRLLAGCISVAALATAPIVSTAAGPSPWHPPASATATTPGTPRFMNFPAPPGVGTSAGEPSIGSNWTSEQTFSNSSGPIPNGGTATYFGGFLPYMLKVTFNDCQSPASVIWDQKTLLTANTTRVYGDPILFTDNLTGRTFVTQEEGLTPLGSTTDVTDNDGDSFLPSQGSGAPSCVDHETVGGGPFHAPLTGTTLYPNAIYYASQCVADASIALSLDGGITFGPSVPMFTINDCDGLHGHIKVAPDGTVYVPDKACGGNIPLLNGGDAAAIVSEDNGTTWAIRPIPDGASMGEWDPSIGVATDGTVYLGYQGADGHPRIAVSHDKGVHWSASVDVGNPSATVSTDTPAGIKNTAFPAVVAGDPNRAAFAFYGTTTADGPGEDHTGGSNDDPSLFTGIWYLFIATTYDGGAHWTTQNVTPGDPIQRGPICGGGPELDPRQAPHHPPVGRQADVRGVRSRRTGDPASSRPHRQPRELDRPPVVAGPRQLGLGHHGVQGLPPHRHGRVVHAARDRDRDELRRHGRSHRSELLPRHRGERAGRGPVLQRLPAPERTRRDPLPRPRPDRGERRRRERPGERFRAEHAARSDRGRPPARGRRALRGCGRQSPHVHAPDVAFDDRRGAAEQPVVHRLESQDARGRRERSAVRRHEDRCHRRGELRVRRLRPAAAARRQSAGAEREHADPARGSRFRELRSGLGRDHDQARGQQGRRHDARARRRPRRRERPHVPGPARRGAEVAEQRLRHHRQRRLLPGRKRELLLHRGSAADGRIGGLADLGPGAADGQLQRLLLDRSQRRGRRRGGLLHVQLRRRHAAGDAGELDDLAHVHEPQLLERLLRDAHRERLEVQPRERQRRVGEHSGHRNDRGQAAAVEAPRGVQDRGREQSLARSDVVHAGHGARRGRERGDVRPRRAADRGAGERLDAGRNAFDLLGHAGQGRPAARGGRLPRAREDGRSDRALPGRVRSLTQADRERSPVPPGRPLAGMRLGMANRSRNLARGSAGRTWSGRRPGAQVRRLGPLDWRFALTALFALAAAWRWAYLARLAQTPFAGSLNADSKIYWDWSGSILRHGLVPKSAFYLAPLYPYVLAVGARARGRRAG